MPTAVETPLLLHGDCIEMLRRLPDASVDVSIADPPAGIGFMGKTWDSFAGYEAQTARGREVADRLGCDALLERAADLIEAQLPAGMTAMQAAALVVELRQRAASRLLAPWAVGFVVFMTDVWTETLRVLKPGAYVCAWALPKTADLQALAMRFAGLDVKDSLLHLFGSGMPHGLDIGKALDKMHGAERWDGWNTELAPGYEQWILARKPTPLTYAKQVLAHGTGAMHVDAVRVPRGEALVRPPIRRDDNITLGCGLGVGRQDEPDGGYPPNVLLSHLPECGERCARGCPARELDEQSGVQKDGVAVKRNGVRNDNIVGFAGPLPPGTADQGYGSGGGASRFFPQFRYQAKARDRRAGLRSDIGNEHPTHKHVDLMRWLVRLLAAKAEATGGDPAIVLDMFMGSGTTGVACVAERVRFIGIERDPVSEGGPQSFHVARSRILAAIGSVEVAAEANATATPGAQLALL